MVWQQKHMLGLQRVSQEEILTVLHTAKSMKDIIGRRIKKVPTLRGRTIVSLFYENSTRTRNSFDLAAKYLSADTVGVAAASSSVQKGESLIDTGRTVEAMGADIIVLRHPCSGAAELLAQNVKCSVINAGDGIHEHPTQALLDMFTILEHKKTMEGLVVTLVGDVLHSRVALSNIYGLTKLGVEVRVVGPATLMPKELEKLGVKVYTNIKAGLKDADVINVLRIQKERQEQGLFPSLREYINLYSVTQERVALAKPDALIMHPGPMNRGVEIDSQVADGAQAVINEQVTNGVAVRMALMFLLSGGGNIEATY